MSRKTTRPPVKVSGWFFYVDLLTKHKNECKQRQKEQTKGHYILKIKMIFHSITPILKNRGQPTLQHSYPSLYYNSHAEHKQSVILHKKPEERFLVAVHRPLYREAFSCRKHENPEAASAIWGRMLHICASRSVLLDTE